MIIDHKNLKLIPNSQEQTCFGCGGKNHNGLRMEFYTDGNRIYSFPSIPVYMAGWGQTVHGGIVSTILDEIMGWGVIYLCRKIGVTQTITVDFVKPVFADKELVVVGDLEEKESHRTVQMTGEIYNSDSVLCARAKADFKVLDPRVAVRLGIVSQEYMQMFEPILNFKYCPV